MSDCRFGVSPVNYPDPDPDAHCHRVFTVKVMRPIALIKEHPSYSVHLLRISCSSVRHFPDMSCIVVDLPCFSFV